MDTYINLQANRAGRISNLQRRSLLINAIMRLMILIVLLFMLILPGFLVLSILLLVFALLVIGIPQVIRTLVDVAGGVVIEDCGQLSSSIEKGGRTSYKFMWVDKTRYYRWNKNMNDVFTNGNWGCVYVLPRSGHVVSIETFSEEEILSYKST